MRAMPSLTCLLPLASLFLVSCSDEKIVARTQLMAVIDAEAPFRDDIRRMRVQVRGRPVGTPVWSEPAFDQEYGQLEWPFNVAIIPEDGDANRNVLLEATAIDEVGNELMTLRAITGFLTSKTLTLPLLFERACLSKACDSEKTCRAGACQSAVIDPRELRDYNGPTLRDAGADAEDTTMDSGSDAAREHSKDAGSSTLRDAGHDASTIPPRDAAPEGVLCGTSQADASPGDDCPDIVLCGLAGRCNVGALTCCMTLANVDDRCEDVQSCANDTRARCDGPEDCRAGTVCCFEGGGTSCEETCPVGYEMCHTASDCTRGSCAKGRPDFWFERLWLYWGFCEP